MRSKSRALVAVLTLTLGVWTHAALAQHDDHNDDHPNGHQQEKTAGHAHDRCQLHGGQVSMTEMHHFETVFDPDGIQVYLYSDRQVPMRVGEAQGTAVLRFKDGATHEVPLEAAVPQEGATTAYFCTGHPDATQMKPGICASCGSMKLMAQDHLFGRVDLSGVEPGTMKAVIEISGMSGKEPGTTFTETFNGLTLEPKETAHHAASEDSGDGHHH